MVSSTNGATFERISDEERVLWSESIPGHLWNAVRRMCECGAEVGVACDLETVEQHLMIALLLLDRAQSAKTP